MDGIDFLSHKTMVVFASIVLSLFFTFYDRMYVARSSYFCVLALFILLVGVGAFYEMHGVVIVSLLIFWASLGERVSKG